MTEHPPAGTVKPVTISYIAQTAGVSIPTVSKVINGRSGVAAETRARVEALISQYGYRKSNPVQRTNLMELVVDDLEHMWGLEIIRGVQRVVREHRVGLVLTEFGPDRNTIRYWIDDTIARRPDCIVTVAQLSDSEQNQLRARGIPFVVLDPASEFPEDVPFVGATNWAGGRSATRHLAGLGHRDIAMISGPGHLYCQARLDGHRSALQAAGLPIRDHDIIRAPLTEDGGHSAAVELLNRPRRPTAIFAGNDLQAVGVYRAAREHGLRIPQDLSVVGFDDLPIAAMIDPGLTTVHQPLTEMAMAATELALALGRGEPVSQTGIELATKLVIRGSTAPPMG
ncbi:LacI family DNA-binding transcriptional regulator [Actinoplanes hulinensis]|uniref:LacI family DNA-binding transcriptional regulator n=1 Tax=Actinoplanes hulinensis TaxID=1144547 RepID=A0ABS7BDR2_9ACTN|nr:LacI family DNA-binding transcriptional regulator [Actinoplanes hulinensis]MBW6439072.1 LacI family DNA-binding transcriptional regulator [Actinoplanes hulinensis]